MCVSSRQKYPVTKQRTGVFGVLVGKLSVLDGVIVVVGLWHSNARFFTFGIWDLYTVHHV